MKRAWFVAAVVAASPLAAEAKVLLWEDFSSGEVRGTEYDHAAVDAAVVDFEGNQVLQLQGSGSVVFGDPAWTDYNVEGDVFVYDASYGAYAAGLLFRGAGDFTSSGAANAYIVQSRPGELQLERWSIAQGFWSHLTDNYAAPVTPGAWHHFKVVARGTRFVFFIDGRFVQEYNDPGAFLSGQVGFRTWGAGAYFDNLLVTDEAPGVALSEDFSAGVIDGRWSFQDQNGPGGSAVTPAAFVPQLVTTPDGRTAMKLQNNGVAVVGDPAWTDYTVEADVFVYDGWYAGGNAAGLLFRATPPLGSWYGFDTYVLQGRTYQSQLEKWYRGAQYEYPIYDVVPGLAFPAGAWHNLKATVDGARVQLFVDGVAAREYVDPRPHLSGAVGFRDYMLGGYYTNLKVTMKDPTPPVSTVTVAGTQGANGWYTSPEVQVVLGATDDRSAVAELWIGLDGRLETAFPPPGASIAWSGEGRHSVSFHAIDAAGNVEPQRVQEVLVDATAPWVTPSFPCATPGNAGWCRAAIPATLVAEDNLSGVAGLAWTVGAAASSVAAPSASFTIGDGSQAVTWRATDVAGNVSADGAATLLVDATPPVANVSATPATIKATGALQAVRIGGQMKDDASGLASTSLKVTDRSGAVVATPAYGSTVMLAGTKGQVYTITASPTDVTGNAKTATAVVKVQ